MKILLRSLRKRFDPKATFGYVWIVYSFARQRSQRGPPYAFDGNRLCGVVISRHPPPPRRLSGWPRSKISDGKPVSLCVVVHSQKKKKKLQYTLVRWYLTDKNEPCSDEQTHAPTTDFPFHKTRVRRGNRMGDRRVRVDKKKIRTGRVCVCVCPETVVHPVVLFLKFFFRPRHVEPPLVEPALSTTVAPETRFFFFCRFVRPSTYRRLSRRRRRARTSTAISRRR